MCGICGKISLSDENTIDSGLIKKMMDEMHHRGPDDEGMYISREVGLGHKRLSIIDVCGGKQPITNEDGTVCVVFNGEIYNYLELREELLGKGHTLKTTTDTEVIVHMYEEYGEKSVPKFRGMFAFALWDEKKKLLLIARDRVGIKPLYYSITNRFLIFASEIKSILVDPEVEKITNINAIDMFLSFYYNPGHESLMKNIFKLKPGHYMIVKCGKVEVKQYWDLIFQNTLRNCDYEELTSKLLTLLKESVHCHMISDVPVGFLLSGGVDSTALLSLAMEGTNKDISTFTIGFEGESFADERPYARLVASQFGTKHYETTISASDFLNFLPKYIWHMEEPVCEPPAVALYYVSKLAREYVKVLISGEGGDEAFAGYPEYRNYVWLERLKKISKPFNDINSLIVDRAGDIINKKLKKYSPLINVSLEEYYYSRTSTPFNYFNRNSGKLYSKELRLRIDKEPMKKIISTYFNNVSSQDYLAKMLYFDTKTWLPDDLLIKADRMTMANSIELRVPLLDHKVLEFAASLPSSYKLRRFSLKYILKKAFSGRVPNEILNRKKTGFPVPYARWLKADLNKIVSDILLDKKTIQRGYFEKKVVEDLIKENKHGRNYSKEIFSLIIIELWHRLFIDGETLTLN